MLSLLEMFFTVLILSSWLFAFANSAHNEETTFPLQDCRAGNVDLLLITQNDYSTDCIGPDVLKTFFNDVINLFSSSTEDDMGRVRVGFMFTFYTGTPSILPFQDDISGKIHANISRFKTCQRPNSRLIAEPRFNTTLEFFFRAFNDEQGSRANADHVAVLVVDGSQRRAIGDIMEVQNRKDQLTDVKLFVVMVNFGSDADKTWRIRNTFHANSYAELVNNQLISMAICMQCLPGWLKYEHKNHMDILSCYFFFSNSRYALDWFQASQKCEELGAELTSIETNGELNFLKQEAFDFLTNDKLKSYQWDYFIGLARDSETIPKRFRWINGNPVVVTDWRYGAPTGGYIQECGFWSFEIPFAEKNVRLVLNLSDYISREFENGWDDTGCGVPMTDLAICEVVLRKHVNGLNFSFTSILPSEESINNALSRGEFVEFQGSIVSVSAQAEKTDFINALRKETGSVFELFDCEEEDEDGGSRKISYSYVCDHIQHCINGRDEEICNYRQCDSVKEFECQSRQCIPVEALCDVYKDCYDGSDEDGCVNCRQQRCCEGVCIPKHWFNDKEVDCSGCHESDFFLDESSLSERDDETCVFICNRTECVYTSQLGDGVVDCRGPEGPLDETIGALERIYYCMHDTLLYKQEWAPLCVYVKDRYGGGLGCRDMAHLLECEDFVCPQGYVKCPNSYCIPIHLLHDGTRDCPLGEDEVQFETFSCRGYFACWNSDVCLHPDLVCDRQPHCPSGDDELNCHVSCANGFRCLAGTVTVGDFNRNSVLQSLAFVDSSTRYLDLSGVEINSSFSRPESSHLKNLVIVRLSGCKITTMEENLIYEASNLQTVYSIDLSRNFVGKIPGNSIFRYMTNLHSLDLSQNSRLSVIEKGSFLPYYKPSLLENLDLSETVIVSLDSHALVGLFNIKVLNLSHTQIVNLDGETFPFDFKLKVLDLRRIPLKYYSSDSLKRVTIQLHLYTDNFGLCCPQIRGPNIPGYVCQAPSDVISSCYNLIREDVQRILLWLVGVTAVLGNIVVIVCRRAVERGVLQKAYGIFVTNLGISDLFMGIYLLVIAGADVYYRDIYVWNNRVWRHSAMCKFAGFLSTFSTETSTFFILLITLDRYLVIRFPFGQYSFSKRGIQVVTTLAWVAGVVLAMIPLLPPSEDWIVYSSNGMCLGLPLTSHTHRPKGWEYSAAVFVGLNSVMFLIIVCGQFSIYRVVSGKSMVKAAAQNTNRRAQEIIVAKQLSLVVLSDFLCWFPVGVMSLLALTGHDIGDDAYAWSAVLVLPVNAALNPLLYTVPVLQARWEKFKNGKQSSSGSKVYSEKSVTLTTLSKTVSSK